jgi:hypothetical protein
MVLSINLGIFLPARDDRMNSNQFDAANVSDVTLLANTRSIERRLERLFAKWMEMEDDVDTQTVIECANRLVAFLEEIQSRDDYAGKG